MANKMNNQYSWNQTLKFSWGHIIAFTALIFASYVAYMGAFYQNGGNFGAAAVKVCCIDVVLLGTFIGAQMCKGSDHKFGRCIMAERVLIILCPVALIWALMPANHFWTVFGEREQIETEFEQSIGKTRQRFDGYDQYANNRIAQYEATLNTISSQKVLYHAVSAKAGLDGTNDAMVKANYIEALRLQLLSENTDSLRQSATAWIDKAEQGVSVWNAFLVGNVKLISSAIEGWHNKLNEVSTPVLSNETATGQEVMPYSEADQSYDEAQQSLKQLSSIYTKADEGVCMATVWSGVLLYAMLLFPYLLQRRNEKAKGYYTLLPGGKHRGRGSSLTPQRRNKGRKPTQPAPANNHANDNDDIFSGTF